MTSRVPLGLHACVSVDRLRSPSFQLDTLQHLDMLGGTLPKASVHVYLLSETLVKCQKSLNYCLEVITIALVAREHTCTVF